MQKAVITIHKQIPLHQDMKVQPLNCLVKQTEVEENKEWPSRQNSAFRNRK